jgi:hypothetical protein
MTKQQSNIIHEYHLNQHDPQKQQFAIYDLHAYLNKNYANTTTRLDIDNYAINVIFNDKLSIALVFIFTYYYILSVQNKLLSNTAA